MMNAPQRPPDDCTRGGQPLESQRQPLSAEVARGAGLQSAGDLEEAARLSEAALERDPGDADARVVGLVWQQGGKLLSVPFLGFGNWCRFIFSGKSNGHHFSPRRSCR